MSEKATETKPTAPETPAAPAVKTYSEAEYNALQEKLASTEKQLSEANTTIQSFKDMDIEGIKKSADDWKQKAEQAEAERKAFEHRTKLSGVNLLYSFYSGITPAGAGKSDIVCRSGS